MIQAYLIFIYFERSVFLKAEKFLFSCFPNQLVEKFVTQGFKAKAGFSTCWTVETTCCLTLSGFQNYLEKLCLFCLCFQIETIGYFNKTTGCFYGNLNREIISIDCFGKWPVVFITEFYYMF